jgi:hypothetical protein
MRVRVLSLEGATLFDQDLPRGTSARDLLQPVLDGESVLARRREDRMWECVSLGQDYVVESDVIFTRYRVAEVTVNGAPQRTRYHFLSSRRVFEGEGLEFNIALWLGLGIGAEVLLRDLDALARFRSAENLEARALQPRQRLDPNVLLRHLRVFDQGGLFVHLDYDQRDRIYLPDIEIALTHYHLPSQMKRLPILLDRVYSNTPLISGDEGPLFHERYEAAVVRSFHYARETCCCGEAPVEHVTHDLYFNDGTHRSLFLKSFIARYALCCQSPGAMVAVRPRSFPYRPTHSIGHNALEHLPGRGIEPELLFFSLRTLGDDKVMEQEIRNEGLPVRMTEHLVPRLEHRVVASFDDVMRPVQRDERGAWKGTIDTDRSGLPPRRGLPRLDELVLGGGVDQLDVLSDVVARRLRTLFDYRTLPTEGVAIAGGAPSLAASTSMWESYGGTTDIDLFVYGPSRKERWATFHNTVEAIVRQGFSQCSVFRSVVHFRSTGRHLELTDENVIRLGYGACSVQVMFTDANTINEVLYGFDMTHVQAALLPRAPHGDSFAPKFFATPEWYAAMETGVTQITRSQIRSFRLVKAVRRGFVVCCEMPYFWLLTPRVEYAIRDTRADGEAVTLPLDEVPDYLLATFPDDFDHLRDEAERITLLGMVDTDRAVTVGHVIITRALNRAQHRDEVRAVQGEVGRDRRAGGGVVRAEPVIVEGGDIIVNGHRRRVGLGDFPSSNTCPVTKIAERIVPDGSFRNSFDGYYNGCFPDAFDGVGGHRDLQAVLKRHDGLEMPDYMLPSRMKCKALFLEVGEPIEEARVAGRTRRCLISIRSPFNNGFDQHITVVKNPPHITSIQELGRLFYDSNGRHARNIVVTVDIIFEEGYQHLDRADQTISEEAFFDTIRETSFVGAVVFSYAEGEDEVPAFRCLNTAAWSAPGHRLLADRYDLQVEQ